MDKKTVKDIDLKGKRVIMRVDFNVPMDKGVVTDDKRIKAALPTIKYVLEQGASLMLMSHLGRPKGGPDAEFSLKAAADVLAGHLDKPVVMAPDCVGPEVEKIAAALKPGDVVMLENTRFHAGEEKNDLDLAKKMAALADVYVNDAFGSAHRAHSSTEGIARFLPAVSGFLMEQELEYLGRAVSNPEHPTSPSWAARRSATKFWWWKPCSRNVTSSSSAAAWPTPSWLPRALICGTAW